MIVMQEKLEPAVSLSWAVYKPPAQIGWLHAEQRDLITEDQVFPSSGPVSVIPTAIFTVAEYEWSEVQW